MNFIHKTLFFSGYNNVSCVFWVCNWLNCNFYAISVKNFTTWTSRNWSNDGAFGNSWQCLGFRIRSRTRIFSTQRSNFSPSVVCIRSNFVRLPGDHKMLEEGFFTELCKLYLLFQGLEAQCAPPCILFPGAWVGGDTNNSTSSGSTMVKIFIVHKHTRPFLLLWSNWHQSQLLRRHWADWQSELFGTRVLSFIESPLKWMVHLPSLCFKIPRLNALVLLKTGWPVSLNRCTILLAVQFHCPFWSWESPYHFSSDPGPRNVQCPCKNLHGVIPDFFGIRSTILIILFPYNVVDTLTWRWSGPWSLLAWCSFSPSRSGSREEEIMTKILGKLSTRIQSVLLRLGTTNTFWDLQLGLSIFLLLLKYLSPVRHKERNSA